MRLLKLFPVIAGTLFLTGNSFSQCTPASDCSSGDGITQFNLNAISHSSGCENGAVNAYSVIAPGVATTNLEQGTTYSVGLQSGFNGQQVSIWIDFNDDLAFAPSELILTDFAVGSTLVNTNVTIPATATLGTHQMRVQANWNSASSGNSCTMGTYGETQDYTVTIIAAPPMTYVSSTTTQASTGNVGNCDASAEIIGVEIVTTGSASPLSLTQLNLSTAGTTNLGDVASINVYYTGNTNAFGTATLFGTGTTGATYSVTGTQALLTGSNYFWIEYVLNPPMTNGNVLDGTCTGITVSGNGYAPTVTSPAGSRSIGACNPNPGGVSANLQAWYDANQGISGAPVTSWSNLGPNANVATLTSTNGGTLEAANRKANFNNIINTTGNHDGTFHAEVSDRTQVITGNEVTMYVAYQRQSAPDLTFNFHGSVQTNPASNGANQWLSWGFRHGGMGSLFSNGTSFLYDNTAMAAMSENAGFVGMHGTGNAAGGNTLNGNDMSYPNIGAFHGGGNFMELSIGYWPGYGMSRGVMEAILWDRDLSVAERTRVQTYLALKYGITQGMNGTSVDYISPSDGSVVWDVSANTGFNYDIAGIARTDASGLDQRKSHSTNGTGVDTYNDIVTMANGTNFASPSAFGSDRLFQIWGHNNATLINTGVVVNYPTDNGETIETIFQREWKTQESGNVGTVTIEFDLSSVIGVSGILGVNDLSYVRLLVDEDGDFSNGATSIAPSAYDNTTDIIYFEHDFNAGTANPLDQNLGFFFTIASTSLALAPLPVELIAYEAENTECTTTLSWSTATEKNSAHYIIERSYDGLDWEFVTTVDAAGESENQKDYSYRDSEAEKNGMVYYRLTQVDLDGTKNPLGINAVNIFCENNLEPVAYPNPMQGVLYVKSPMDAVITVQDMHGRILMNKELSKGMSGLDVEKLANGTYLITIEMSNGKRFVDQFMKL